MLPRSRLLTTLALTAVAAAIPVAPALAKGDRDGLPDRWEKRHHLNRKADDSRRDRDRDGLSNFGEYRSHTNPRKADSDRDGRRDGREDFDRDRLRNAAEIQTGNDPGDADSDNDGIKDGREYAGRITAVDGGFVTIALATGGSITARLTCTEPSGQPGGVPVEEPVEPTGDDLPDPAEDAEDADAVDDPVKAAAAQDDEPDEGAFDREFEEDFGSCAVPALKAGAVVHEAEIRQTGNGPVVVGIKLVARKR